MVNESDQLRYSDLYDRFTVEECRRLVKSFDERLAEISPDDPEREDKIGGIKMAHRLFLWRTTGERAAKKAEQIREWLARDARQEELVASA
jgi:hypothetical protein